MRKSVLTKAGSIYLKPNVADNLTTIFPLFWVNETARVHDAIFDEIRYKVYPLMAFTTYGPLIMITIGVILSIIGVFKWRNLSKGRRSEPSANRNGSFPQTQHDQLLHPMRNRKR